MTGPVIYGADVLARIAAHCEADPKREVCGFVVRRGERLEVVGVPNVADRYHALDPARFPRSARDGYLMDPGAQLRVLQDAEAAGGEVVAVWHSHLEVGAYFSEKDRADAIVDGRPVLPGAEYLVAGVRGGRVDELRRFRHVDGEFRECSLP